MSVSGILSSNLHNSTALPQSQQLRKGFQQLSQDLQSGNLSAAASDFSTVQQTAQSSSTAASASNNPISQAFHQLAIDLQSGNIPGTQEQGTPVSANPIRITHPISVGGPARLFPGVGPDDQSSVASTALQSYNAAQQVLQSAQLGSLASLNASLPDIADSLSVSA